MTLFQKALDYLGLGGDGAYVDYEDDIQDEPDYGLGQRVDQRDVRRGVPGPANRSRLDDLDGLDEMQSESAIRRQQ